ncbi:MAG: hypothetical protein PUD59_03640 [bacterium]|nr:hypothetical protein [bacterium]
MKKFFLIFIIMFLITGCTYVNFNNLTEEQIINDTLSRNINYSNKNYNGYKLYVPRGLKVIDKDEYNLKILNENDVFYLYVDVISYYYKTNTEFESNPKNIVSRKINSNGKNGSIDISKIDEKYFIQIIYNYSKIQGYVAEKNLKKSLVNMITILSSIQYNDKVINTLIDEELLDYKEEKLDIFESKSETSNFLEALEKYDVYIDENNDEDNINIEFNE